MEDFRSQDEYTRKRRSLGEGDSSQGSSKIKGISRELREMKEALNMAGYYKSKKEKKPLKFPVKWNAKIKKSQRKKSQDDVLVFYLTSKGELTHPFTVPILGGNLLIHKNKVHEFNPSDLLTMRIGANKIVKTLIIREIDRKPVSNKDWDEVKKRGDSTRNDEVLLKMLKLAMIEKVKKQVNKGILWMIGLALALGVVAYVIFA